MVDAALIRSDFPIFLNAKSAEKPFCYLDNAATTQKPEAVISAVADYYRTANANAGRGIYELGHRSTLLFEATRKKVARFLKAAPGEIIFTGGATGSINLVAASFLEPILNAGDNVVVTQMEHHANFIPWQQLCIRTGAEFRIARLDDHGDVDLDHFDALLDERTAMVACTHISNALGTVNPIGRVISLAHEKGIPALIDGAQGILSEEVDVRELDVDFYCFSVHKMFGPTGLGVLYGKADLLEKMRPFQTGGGMIRSVANDHTSFARPPARFEAGTPHMAGVAGLNAALDYISSIGKDSIHAHICRLNQACRERLNELEGIEILPGGRQNAGITSFISRLAHPHDIATVLDQSGVAVRAGHHCTEPLMRSMNLHGTVRVSFSVYNELWEIDRLVEGLKKVHEIFG